MLDMRPHTHGSTQEEFLDWLSASAVVAARSRPVVNRADSPQSTGTSPRLARGSLTSRSQPQLPETLAARNERKRAEADVRLLTNRLAHLRLEEERARRKAQETVDRARQISELKER